MSREQWDDYERLGLLGMTRDKQGWLGMTRDNRDD